MRDHRGHWIARRLRPGGPAPVRIVRLLGSAQPEQRGILVGDLARLSQVPSLGRESISRGRGGTRARGVHLRGRGLGRRRGGQRAPWPAGPAGGAATSAPPGAGSQGPWGAAPVCDPTYWVAGLGVAGGGAGRAGLLTWLYPLPSALGFPRPHLSGTSIAPHHPRPDFHLPAQRALFAGLHRDVNLGAA